MIKCFIFSIVAAFAVDVALAENKLRRDASPTRYELLFHVFELGVPDPKLDIEIGQVIDGDLGEISAARISYWAGKMAPSNKDEEVIAVRFLESEVKEVRLIAGWALMARLQLRKTTLPDTLSPMFAGDEIGSDEHKRFVSYLRSKLAEDVGEVPGQDPGKGKGLN